jgi:hypothetical protein
MPRDPLTTDASNAGNPRPAEPRVLAFEDVGRVAKGGTRLEDIVPIEHVRDGDVQVRAGHPRRYGPQPPVDLDLLAEYPSVRSVVATTVVHARRPLPNIVVLILRVDAPTAETLRHLPNLRRLASGRLQTSKPTPLDTSALPPTLEALNVARHSLVNGWLKKLPEGAPARFTDIGRLTGLRRLTLRDCWPGDSVAPRAALTSLTYLECDAPNGWSALRALAALESVIAVRPKVTNLRAFRSWTRLRSLTLGNSGVKSLDGAESFRSLERVKLFLLKVADLGPLAGLRKLEHVELQGLNNVADISVLGTLPSLRYLEIASVGHGPRDTMHVRSLAPLASAEMLEVVSLAGVVVDDRDVTPLVQLPRLRRVKLYGDLGDGVDALRRARPEVAVEWNPAPVVPGEVVGAVRVRPPLDGTTEWWISDDLTDALGARTNADAERRLVAALRSEAPELLKRLDFDTEADAVVIRAPNRDDILAVAKLIATLYIR